jgi:hypothetical protein
MSGQQYLRRRITWSLAVKLLALCALYWLFFGPSERVNVDARRVQAHFFPTDDGHSSGE